MVRAKVLSGLAIALAICGVLHRTRTVEAGSSSIAEDASKRLAESNQFIGACEKMDHRVP